MGRIRVAPRLWATSPAAQAGRLPCGVSARESRRNRHRGVANDCGCIALVLPSPQGHRLLCSIVQPAGSMTADGSFTRPLRCLSWMKGNFHVQFLGEGGESNLASLSRPICSSVKRCEIGENPHIPANLVVEHITTHRNPPEVRI